VEANDGRALPLELHRAGSAVSEAHYPPPPDWGAGDMSSLGVKALLGLVALALIEGLLLFLAAGSVHYWQAWVYLGIFFGIAVATTLYLMKNDPALLKRRLSGGPLAERQATQQLIMFLAAIGFVGLLAVSSFDHRFRWSSVPNFVVIIGDLLIALGFFIIFLVYKENSFTSATIEVSSGQSVISTGPYAIVRHPMYAGTRLLLGTHRPACRTPRSHVAAAG
jgi:protein-S-isoprenylcysteine O-methyltransferase Ste14